MKIIYEGTDIYEDISLNYAVHEMYAEGESDTLVLRFNDPKGVWPKWEPKPEDIIELEHKKAKTGKMFVTSMTAENGIYTIRAQSMPRAMKTKRTASWQQVTLIQIITEIAGRHGLSLGSSDVNNQTYTKMFQEDESDIAFICRLCRQEGIELIIYDKQIIVYDPAKLEKKTPNESLRIGEGAYYTYDEGFTPAYDGVKVLGGSYTGTAGKKEGNILTLHTRANSASEATRFAKNIFDYFNKRRLDGCVVLDFDAKYAACGIIDITTDRAKTWNGKCFVTKVRHDYVKNTSTVFFRKVEE